jgi:hypothetical protein
MLIEYMICVYMFIGVCVRTLWVSKLLDFVVNNEWFLWSLKYRVAMTFAAISSPCCWCFSDALFKPTIVLKRRQHNSSIQFYFFISFCVTLSFFYNTNYFLWYESDMRHLSCIFLKKHSTEFCLKIKSSKFRRIQKHRHTFHETYCFGPNIFWADIGPKHEKQ